MSSFASFAYPLRPLRFHHFFYIKNTPLPVVWVSNSL